MPDLILPLTEAEVDQLDALRADCGFEGNREVFNSALTLLHLCVQELKAGKKIGSIDDVEETICEFELPCFEKISRSPL